MESVRYFIDGDPQPIIEHAFQSVQRERAWRAKNGQSADLPPANYLAVSGGGDNGAFGAGLLVGWSQTGNRPEFKIVTGISTGALIAPFAYLGPNYDAKLREVYTTISPDNILKKRSLLAILSSDSAADNAPLWQLVRKHAGAEMLQAIGEEYDKGRLLLIATTNLDAQRPVVWNIGEIAKSGHPKALDLFHSILVASAAIPGAFPPVMFDVTVNGKAYQEMHVDGGTISQVFLYPPSINVEEASEKFGVQRERKLYVIRNARLDPEWASVERQIFGIASRAISTLIQNQGVGDLYQIFLTAQRDNIDYNLAFIPSTFDAVHKEQFDTEYMNELFGLGVAMAKPGYPWEKFPPGYNPDD
jgi:predicted patatin/cPLA2 family phospholipase